MSCHSIGHGLNSVSKKVLELYDEGKIEFSVAKDLLYTTRNAVHYNFQRNEMEQFYE